MCVFCVLGCMCVWDKREKGLAWHLGNSGNISGTIRASWGRKRRRGMYQPLYESQLSLSSFVTKKKPTKSPLNVCYSVAMAKWRRNMAHVAISEKTLTTNRVSPTQKTLTGFKTLHFWKIKLKSRSKFSTEYELIKLIAIHYSVLASSKPRNFSSGLGRTQTPSGQWKSKITWQKVFESTSAFSKFWSLLCLFNPIFT